MFTNKDSPKAPSHTEKVRYNKEKNKLNWLRILKITTKIPKTMYSKLSKEISKCFRLDENTNIPTKINI